MKFSSRLLYALPMVLLVACSADDGSNDIGPEPDARLSSYSWSVVDAKSATGINIEPVSQLVVAGKPPILLLNHGFYTLDHGVHRGSTAEDICSERDFAYRYSEDQLRYDSTRNPLGPTPTVNCGDDFLEVTRRFLELFRAGAKWASESSTTTTLTLVSATGETYRFTGIPR